MANINLQLPYKDLTDKKIQTNFLQIQRLINNTDFGGGGGYASLMGPGKTTMPGDLYQIGGFVVDSPGNSLPIELNIDPGGVLPIDIFQNGNGGIDISNNGTGGITFNNVPGSTIGFNATGGTVWFDTYIFGVESSGSVGGGQISFNAGDCTASAAFGIFLATDSLPVYASNAASLADGRSNGYLYLLGNSSGPLCVTHNL
jgi:hypothetical protein